MLPNELTWLMDRHAAAHQPRQRPESLGNAGGASGSRLWRYPSESGLLLVRRWPRGAQNPMRLAMIHEWLARAQALDYVPVPIPDRAGSTFAAHASCLWELTPWLPGAARVARHPPEKVHVQAAFRALALFHGAVRIETREGPSPNLAARRTEVDGWLAGGFARLSAAIARSPSDRLAVAGRRWLELARQHAPFVSDRLRRALARTLPLQPCLRDARPEHFLFVGETLTGLVDFGAMGIDSVATDLARLLALWLGNDRGLRAAALEAYESVRELAEAERAAMADLELSAALLGGGHWLGWHFIEGREFEGPEVVERGVEAAIERLIAVIAATISP